LTFVDLTAADLARAAELVETSVDLPLDATDAGTVALAERLGVSAVLTIDTDFRVLRPSHIEAFRVVPEQLA
jgi:predicted nucleic acid-binding protein